MSECGKSEMVSSRDWLHCNKKSLENKLYHKVISALQHVGWPLYDHPSETSDPKEGIRDSL